MSKRSGVKPASRPTKDDDDDDNDKTEDEKKKENDDKEEKAHKDSYPRNYGVEAFLLNPEIIKCYFIGVILLIVLGVLIILFTLIAIPGFFDLPILIMSPCDSVIPDQCTGGRQFVSSSCALPCPDGFNHSLVCTCSKGATLFSCDLFGKLSTLPVTCPLGREFLASTCVLQCPSGWTRTAACTCTFGTVITDCNRFGQGGTIPRICPIDRDYVDGMCYKKCNPGYIRVPGAPCTCQFGEVINDCARFGVSQVMSLCPAGRDFYASECLDPCPVNSLRTTACGCTFGTVETDCNAFGFAQSYACDVDTQQEVAGLCYIACPFGGIRTAICSCQYPGAGTGPVCISTQVACPPGFPLYPPTCSNLCGTRSACCGSVPDLLCGGNSVTVTPTCNNPSFPIFSLDDLCYQIPCPAGGQRAGPYECNYPGVVSTIDGASGCNATHPLGPFDCPGVNCFCYAYGGNLTFTGYGPFFGGSTVSPASVCPTGFPDQVGSVCFQFFCPVNDFGELGTRTGQCTCTWTSCAQASTGQIASCNATGEYPLFNGAQCCPTQGLQTNCVALNGGIGTIPSNCPVGTDNTGGACYRSCPPGFCRSALCSCSNREDTIDCSLFGNPKPIGDPLGPICTGAQDQFGGVCYSGKCPAGYTRTASCACSNYKLTTNCTTFGDPRGVGDPQGPQCNPGEDYFGGLCYTQACASNGMARTAACSCSNFQLITNCSTFGDPKPLGDPLGPGCSFSEDYFAGICYREKCPLPQLRTGACSCSDFETKTDCQLYGDNKYGGDASGLGPTCRPGFDYVDLLCYKPQCPVGRTRTAACSCTKDT